MPPVDVLNLSCVFRKQTLEIVSPARNVCATLKDMELFYSLILVLSDANITYPMIMARNGPQNKESGTQHMHHCELKL